MRYLFVGGEFDGETRWVASHFGNHTPPAIWEIAHIPSPATRAQTGPVPSLTFPRLIYKRVEIGTGEYIYAEASLTNAEVRRKLHESYMPHVASELADAIKPLLYRITCIRLNDDNLSGAVALRGVHEALSDLLRKYKP